MAQAFEAKKEAAVALEVARLAVNQQLTTNAEAVDHAWRSMQAAQSATGQSVSRLQVDVAAREARAPLSGIVVAVGAEEGKAAAGPLVTVADPERLVLRATVNKVDSGKVSVGDEVTFTTPTTGGREYRGRVLTVSTVAEPPADPTARDTKPAFPVEIEVTGDVEGLRIGGTAKARITTDKVEGALAVPRDALTEDDKGQPAVLVLRPRDKEHVVELVPVTPGVTTDFEVTVTGLQAGDLVLNQAATHRNAVGEVVHVEEKQ
ncbi:MAG: HlyD family efflux transporter periplasmic adaptor subunit [Corynebacterium humireducens]|uniref:HlyD family efflux transporter periplasmic adaptor subunit n=1 Tax=Corynebacterium humireducens TaxID=1223514 RepID=A0A7X6SV27_9CORY|nr:HlyD family efflux transporter periplasmic adaptor subunit [Corynebacterium humireducens]